MEGDDNNGEKSKRKGNNNSKAEFVGEERFDDNESETSILVATNADIDMDVDGEGLEFLLAPVKKRF